MNRGRRAAVALALLVGAVTRPGGAGAKPFVPDEIPIARVIANVESYAAAHPKDPAGLYMVGRAHYAALYDLRGLALNAGDATRAASLPAFFGVRYPAGAGTVSGLDVVLVAHVDASVSALQRAVALSRPGTSALYLLTLGSVAETVAPFSTQLGAPPRIGSTRPKTWRDAAARAYLRAYDLAIARDLRITEQPLFGLATLVAYEAGDSYLRLVPNGRRRTEIRAALTRLEGKPPGPVTPLIFSLAGPRRLADLLDPGKVVGFDLDGTGRVQQYGWLRSDTAVLVWDPDASGSIVSGRQLFGNATWWMLWSDAYRALDALDDDRDGTLRGPELSGLAVWRDTNQNAISEAGEVAPVASVGIVAMASRPDGRIDGVLSSSLGILLASGARLPTYDWVATPR